MKQTWIAQANFVLASRHLGYKSAEAALGELVDNSLEAQASTVCVLVRLDSADSIKHVAEIAVIDDGVGMNAAEMGCCLQFGGSTRFGSRCGLGRFGMGLPSSSLSHARRVDVYSWQNGTTLHTSLDLDGITSGVDSGPRVKQAQLPRWMAVPNAQHGSAVVWSNCDRLPFKRLSTIVNRFRASLGRMYRKALTSGICIYLNEEVVPSADPLFRAEGGVLFCEPLHYDLRSPLTGDKSRISIYFTELPVVAWRELTNDQKRARGIVGGAGMSVLRAGREIDQGWFFMGGKRRENYDDWWRCELHFEPELDELFGVTTSKQSITPTSEIRAILEPDVEAIARQLNSRVRRRFIETQSKGAAASRATSRDAKLPPLVATSARGRGLSFSIVTKRIPSGRFFLSERRGRSVRITLNEQHPFYTNVYEPALTDAPTRFAVESLLISFARARVATGRTESVDALIERWSDAVANVVRK